MYYHTNSQEHPNVLHSREECPHGKQIEPEHRVNKWDRRRECKWCSDRNTIEQILGQKLIW